MLVLDHQTLLPPKRFFLVVIHVLLLLVDVIIVSISIVLIDGLRLVRLAHLMASNGTPCESLPPSPLPSPQKRVLSLLL